MKRATTEEERRANDLRVLREMAAEPPVCGRDYEFMPAPASSPIAPREGDRRVWCWCGCGVWFYVSRTGRGRSYVDEEHARRARRRRRNARARRADWRER